LKDSDPLKFEQAIRNYEQFYGLKHSYKEGGAGSKTRPEEVKKSKEGIDGWAKW